MTITKKTLTMLKRYGNCTKPNYNCRISVISDILSSAEVICGNTKEGFEIYSLDNCSESICAHVTSDYSRKLCQGMTTRYPHYINTTMTHGNNVATITEVDKLVSAILSE